MQSVPPITDDDKPALLALVSRYCTHFYATELDQELLKEVQARLVAGREQFARLHAAFDVFGLNIRKDGGGLKLIRKTLGDAAYIDAVNRGRAVIGLPEIGHTPGMLADAADDQSGETPGRAVVAVNDASPSVREMVLETLETAGEMGRKAQEIRAEIESRRSTKLHDKTVGMTLYRLSQAKPPLVLRKGTTWFFVPQDAEKKNPGGETPGSSNVFN